MRFKKGDLLTTKHGLDQNPVARVESVTKEGVVNCFNLVACATMNEGAEFQFTPDEYTWYVLHSRSRRRHNHDRDPP